MTRTDIVVELTKRIISMAREAGADCIVTGCSMCHANLDTRQAELPGQSGRDGIPVFYFTELMGLAMGNPSVKAWFGRHITDPMKVLSNKGLV